MSKRLSELTVSGSQLATWLAEGRSIVVPTDTVYGLAALPTVPEGVAGIFTLKGRPQTVPLPVIIGGLAQLAQLGVLVTPAARALFDVYWPGPLTLVFGLGKERPQWLAEREEVAIRWPASTLLSALASAAGPFLLTSANGHGAGPADNIEDAIGSLHGTPDIVIDGGQLKQVPSTLVNTRLSPPRIERIGALTPAQIEAIAGPIEVAEGA